jgi:hypothetical protein
MQDRFGFLLLLLVGLLVVRLVQGMAGLYTPDQQQVMAT